MRTTRAAVAASATLTMLLVAGCAAEESAPGDEPSATAEMPDGTGSDEMSDGDMTDDEDSGADMADDMASPAVYDFSAMALDGGTFEGTSLEGEPAVLWFWAPWCPTCRAQIPAVTGLADDYGDDVTVVGVGGLDDAEAISEMAEQDIVGITHLVDDAGDVWQHFGITQQSTFVVLDPAGEIVLEGSVPESELESTVADLAG